MLADQLARERHFPGKRISAEDKFRLELDYCVPKGIPHSVFLDWEEYDQDKALAWMIEDRTRCQRCGTKPTEWLDKEGYEVEPPPYHATDRRCYGCATLDDHRSRIPSELRSSIDAYLVPGEGDHAGDDGRSNPERRFL